MEKGGVSVVPYDGARLADTAGVLARAFASDPVFEWVSRRK